ncbi:hypothetical protein [uncultured Selenomonas sp.]|uniref:hypothetical protein n=1 Tax=uncultured Selenomonas sp. TaxID=159275 RepID=UPI0028D13311|nr:hypothetical protein [uncultured Selenomonas sp.]
MDLKEELKALASTQGMTFKELAMKAGLHEKGLHNKFQRNSLTVKDLSALLSVLGHEMTFRAKDKR